MSLLFIYGRQRLESVIRLYFEIHISLIVFKLLIVYGLVLIFGILIEAFATAFSVNRYLRMTTNKLYHV